MKNKKILGLDLGSNSVGWALVTETNGMLSSIDDLGARIFNKAVEEKTPTPKNMKRRDMRLGRRVIQRRARRKQKMLNYLVSLDLLPKALQGNTQPEIILNTLGNPYTLRAKALDEQLTPHEFGRVLLHFVARRGFLSSKKQVAGDLVDDPDTIAYLQQIDADNKKDDEEGQFKADIKTVYEAIEKAEARTLGEYLHKLDTGACKRNRSHAGGHLRTDRAMYQNELERIWQQQKQYFPNLPDDFMADKKGVKQIIFYQRPLKLKKDRIGPCSLEPNHHRADMARLEVQRFRYLQDINNLQYFENHSEQWLPLNDEQKQALTNHCEYNSKVTLTALKKVLGLDRPTKLNLETKNLKGNVTACEIRSVIGDKWDTLDDKKQHQLFEDLFTIKKKSALKKRLINHWQFDTQTAVKLCLVEFEPGHSNHSLKAIRKLLPFLEQGLLYSKKDTDTGELGALQAAGYTDKKKGIEGGKCKKLPAPPETSNPIVNKGLHELKRVVNAIIKEHGKPDIVRIEMARDLEMNTQRYKNYIKQQSANARANDEAQKAFAGLNLGTKYASRDDKLKYRLWQDQGQRCAYSGSSISLTQVFSSATEIDHILPFAQSLDDSYMNKVICFAAENRDKAGRTPIDAWGTNADKWNQITQATARWHNGLKSKIKRFYQTEQDLQQRDFIQSQLNDTRYISKLAQDYLRQLGCDVSVTKGAVVAKIRHQWGLNSLLGEHDKKERTDHRHHAIDAVVIAATSRGLYQQAVQQIKQDKLTIAPPYNTIKADTDEKLKHLIISHVPQRKLSGALHEETGAGYIAKHGGLVYRKMLTPEFTIKNAQSIVDEEVKNIVLEHIANYPSVKEAFADGVTVYHKDGKTPIKRVRVLQSKTTEKKLSSTKFAVKDKAGKVFKYMSYGNTHHVEIIRHKETGKIQGEFVTMMEAAHRVRGIGLPKQSMIKTDPGGDYEFLMALHINDTVSVLLNGERVFYRVQKIDIQNNKFVLRLNTASTLSNKSEELNIGISKENLESYQIKLHRVNAIGALMA